MTNLDREIERQQESLITAVQNIIRIKSVEAPPQTGKPFGAGVAEALDHALDLAAGMGFKTVNLDGYAGYAEYGEGDDYIGILGHLDVVPEGNGWTHPPYGGEIHDRKIFGRGTADDKGPIIAALFALNAIKNLSLPLTKKVRIIFGTNEETGCKDMDYYNAKEKPPVAGFTPDACFPAIHAEKGPLGFTLTKQLKPGSAAPVEVKSLYAGERANIVPDYSKALVEAADPAALIAACSAYAKENNVRITATPKDTAVFIESFGKAAHASIPHTGVNAAIELLAFLSTYPVSDDLAVFFQAVNTYIGKETDGRSLGIGLADAESGKLTLNAGLLRMTENQITLTCDVRFPVTFRSQDLIEKLRAKTAQIGLDLGIRSHREPLYFAKDHPLIQTLQHVFSEKTGITAEPLAIGGGTYAKVLPNIVAYGPQFPGQPDLCHQADEYVAIDELIMCAKIYAQAIYKLAK